MAWESNPDGAGFAFNTNDGRVRIVKGLMTWKDFYSTFKAYSNKYDFYKRGVLIHFRIATHGGVNPECTHPFPLSNDSKMLQKTDTMASFAIIHNGKIDLTAYDTYSKTKMSDTMIFVQKYLTKLASNAKWFYNPDNMDLIHELINSKMAILNSRGEIRSTEGFTKDKDGNFYSNDTYKVPRIRYTYTTPTPSSSTTYSSGSYTSSYCSNYWKELMKIDKDDYVKIENGNMVKCTGEYPIFMDADKKFYCLSHDYSVSNSYLTSSYVSGEFTMLFNSKPGELYRNGVPIKFEPTHRTYSSYIERAKSKCVPVTNSSDYID